MSSIEPLRPVGQSSPRVDPIERSRALRGRDGDEDEERDDKDEGEPAPRREPRPRPQKVDLLG